MTTFAMISLEELLIVLVFGVPLLAAIIVGVYWVVRRRARDTARDTDFTANRTPPE